MTLPEAYEMYTNAMVGRTNGTHLRGFEAGLRDYARWEYGRNDVAWLLTRETVRRRPPRRILRRLAAWLREDYAITAVPAPENQGR